MKKWIVGVAATLLVPLANAALFQYEANNVAPGRGGSFDSLVAQYDTSTSLMAWSADNLVRNGHLMDAAFDDGIVTWFYTSWNARTQIPSRPLLLCPC